MVLFCTACLAAVSIAGMRGLSFDTDVLSLLPRDGRVVPAFRTFVATFGSVDDLYVVLTAPDGHEISEYEDDVDAWGERLRETPGIVRVDTGRVDESRDLSWLADHRLLLLDDDHLGRALSRFSGDGLVASLRGRRALLSVPSPAIAGMVRHDPLGLYDLLREQLGSAQAGINLGVTEGGYVASDLRSRLLIAKPSQPPFDAGFSRALMTRLDALRDEMGRHAPRAGEPVSPDEERPPLRVQFAGGHRIAVETESVIRRESILNTVGSLALILPLLFLVFRSLWLVLVGSIPSALSLVLTLGMLGFAGATLSTAATASSAMLFGLGVDGVVLLYVGYTLAVRAGAEPAAAIDGLGGPASSMLLGMWTTAATFYGLTFVDFPSLEQLGALIGHSMVICGILTLVMVPALLPLRTADPAHAVAVDAAIRVMGRAAAQSRARGGSHPDRSPGCRRNPAPHQSDAGPTPLRDARRRTSPAHRTDVRAARRRLHRGGEWNEPGGAAEIERAASRRRRARAARTSPCRRRRRCSPRKRRKIGVERKFVRRGFRRPPRPGPSWRLKSQRDSSPALSTRFGSGSLPCSNPVA